MTSRLQNKKATKLKFFIRHAFVPIFTQAKFHFNRLMVTLIFGIRAWLTIEKAWPDIGIRYFI